MYVCVCIYIYIYTYIHTHTHIHIHISTSGVRQVVPPSSSSKAVSCPRDAPLGEVRSCFHLYYHYYYYYYYYYYFLVFVFLTNHWSISCSISLFFILFVRICFHLAPSARSMSFVTRASPRAAPRHNLSCT